jgi:hypothetical protein
VRLDIKSDGSSSIQSHEHSAQVHSRPTPHRLYNLTYATRDLGVLPLPLSDALQDDEGDAQLGLITGKLSLLSKN